MRRRHSLSGCGEHFWIALGRGEEAFDHSRHILRTRLESLQAPAMSHECNEPMTVDEAKYWARKYLRAVAPRMIMRYNLALEVVVGLLARPSMDLHKASREARHYSVPRNSNNS